MAVSLFMLYHSLSAWQAPSLCCTTASLHGRLPLIAAWSPVARLVLLLRGPSPWCTGRILLKGDNITLMQTVGRQAAA